MAESDSKPSVIRWAIRAWSEALAAIEQMPWVFGAAFLALVSLYALEIMLLPRAVTLGAGFLVLRVGVGIAQSLLLTPVVIAVHRFVILHEQTLDYRLDLTDPRLRRFFFFAIAIQAFVFVPNLVLRLAGAMLGQSGSVWIEILGFIVIVMWAWLTLRTMILFPAIAVDAPGAGLRNALLDSGGHNLRILAMVLVTAIPIFALSVLELLVLGRPTGASIVGGIVLIILRSVEIMVPMAVFAALASRMFLALANRLAGPATPPGQV